MERSKPSAVSYAMLIQTASSLLLHFEHVNSTTRCNGYRRHRRNVRRNPHHPQSIVRSIVSYFSRDIDSAEPSVPPPRPPTDPNTDSLAIVLRDSPDWLAYIRALQETDVVILLTPVVIPVSQNPADISDPFEPFGRALARRHARIRHVPYTSR